ncbi:LysM-like peptidoglycan-binding domain-containing protein [Mannheimia haemolytica]|uniref:LysM-like peptidoglycan-binding domain-containing protein n=1 Tax=Mannheimia haemolytica TaxID=75985 RepID=UPI002EC572FE|nr:LysM-like peptidoglycan-binding domain-containing protein [Mannheimia haemolytica]
MTQNNFRKEPVFGESSVTSQDAEATKADTAQAPYVSLRSTKAPGHTFTPIMKRPDAKVEDHTADVFSAKQAKEFQFTPSSEATEATEAVEPDNTIHSVEESVSTASFNTVEAQENVEKEVVKPAPESFTTERIIPNAATAVAAATAAAAATKTKEIKAKMPPKTRRLLLVALLALALLVLFFLLKPSTPETVEELQSQQGGSLPIEFRPVDEAEAKRAEEQARAEQEAAEAAKAQEQAQAAQQESVTVAPAQTEQTMAKPSQDSQSQTQSQAVVEQPVAVKPVENKPVVAQPAIKPKTENSVVFQPETTVKQQPKAPAKTEVKTERATLAAKETAKTAAKPVEKAPTKTEAVKAAPAAESANAVATKTMTVPKGVSLMQVFRDNNLNISDVNAMSKVNNVVSNLKVGERVTVRLDKNNRVVEMSIGSGGKFTRQANGSYTFK